VGPEHATRRHVCPELEHLRRAAEPSGLVIETDEGKLSQILRNLISNALKYTERGEVRVTCELAEHASRVLFSVRDTGIGIAPQDQETIFQEFGRIDSAVSRRVRGTGLGLPLSRRLVELLGGRLWLDSEPGRGSTFYVSLPAVGQTSGAGASTTVPRLIGGPA
jgi:signal transduction histidine kinase